jgi:hypothetical protein
MEGQFPVVAVEQLVVGQVLKLDDAPDLGSG